MALSNRTIALIAGCFGGGSGPSHATIRTVFAAAEAEAYLLRAAGNKLDSVLYGLRYLRDGAPATDSEPALPPDPHRLLVVRQRNGEPSPRSLPSAATAEGGGWGGTTSDRPVVRSDDVASPYSQGRRG